MGKPIMLRAEDDRRIEALKRDLRIGRKVDVVRAGLELLEKEAERLRRVERWKRAVALAADTSREVNADFRAQPRLKRP